MLYQIYDFQKALLQPLTEWAKTTAETFVNPANPLSLVPGAERLAASYELLHRLGKDYKKPEFGIRSVKAHGKEVVVQEFTALAKPFCNLVRFKRFSDDIEVISKMKQDPVVLIVAPLSGHHSTLLRDTVRTMLQDHKVYITDWIDARMVPNDQGVFGLDDYVHYIEDFIRHIGAENLHVISVCQPTVPVLGAVSLMASRGESTPRSLVMMGGPIDARKSPTAVNSLAMSKSIEWFEANTIHNVPPPHPGVGRRVYPGFLQHMGFIAMNPSNHLQSHWDYFQNLVRGDEQDAQAHIRFYDEYNAVLDMDAHYYLDTIRTVFKDYALPNGTWMVRNELVKPQDIQESALLTIEGEMDDISGSGQTRAAHKLCKGIEESRKEHYEVSGAGHYGIFSGSRWRNKVYPRIQQFIRAHHSSNPSNQDAN
ncbi:MULTISPECIES: polyhydroxyalkanoate depolymerase [unclassified Polynucleobacter]|uniref:polyhydroxyalkanoate depolymerase n=1 Tax=unclassified Polynucleobacter TaxID=2640945 RepID=UPI00257371A6|nr:MULTISPECIES: polyhydroxyalkanoate depolymerase [unclassified Polynucleobacter]BEI34988.1 polyhydroxyalkanoate depolymerase [Polynucleobacter sp. HIN6]BEI36818.1 polyhydroxyalkanoate depolymerase [Polynucleobacter sp. HIN7]BEI40577.1 polyhydroxyalkanoate depolymerase [Polynucleobacter sp. HIN9]